MSKERRTRQEQRQGTGQQHKAFSKIGIVIAVIAVAGGLLWFLNHKHNRQLDAFAQCLGSKGAKMYGAFWCPHCADQKDMFGSSFEYAPYIECGIKGSRSIAIACTEANVKEFPTWVFADGARVIGAHSLDFLSQATGCPLP